MTHQDVLRRLQEGNRRFVADSAIYPRLTSDRREELRSQGQDPIATVIACSDSRVPVEHIFDKGMGDLFTIRVAGNIAGSTQIGTVEFSLSALGVPLIVVLGHDDCGAVKASVDEVEASGHLLRLIRVIHPVTEMVRHEYPNLSREELIPRVINENVFLTIESLITGSNMIAEAVRKKKVRIVGAVFDIASGKVTWMGDHPDQRAFLKQKKLPLRYRIGRHSSVEEDIVE
ncbi:carbonic anhydrase [bacterium]|nr:carbonic anhydrase [bacterium]